MDTSKVLEYFDASAIDAPIHVIGCGAIGSHIAEQLVRIGCKSIDLWDFDIVSPHNITNQLYTEYDVLQPKIEALARQLTAINPQVKLTLHPKGWNNDIVKGYIFLCVDSIALRRAIINTNKFNPYLIAFFDFRMRLTDAQHYYSDKELDNINRLLSTMDFTDAEAKEATPKSACNTELSVITTVKVITALGINNFIKHVLGIPTKHMILLDLNLLTIDAF